MQSKGSKSISKNFEHPTQILIQTQEKHPKQFEWDEK
jgi:hypothetical protein